MLNKEIKRKAKLLLVIYILTIAAVLFIHYLTGSSTVDVVFNVITMTLYYVLLSVFGLAQYADGYTTGYAEHVIKDITTTMEKINDEAEDLVDILRNGTTLEGAILGVVKYINKKRGTGTSKKDLRDSIRNDAHADIDAAVLQLVREGKLVKFGTTRNTKYYLPGNEPTARE